jgi:glucose/arabinose dehydrogenase
MVATRVMGALVLLAALLTGCGGDDGADLGQGSPTTAGSVPSPDSPGTPTADTTPPGTPTAAPSAAATPATPAAAPCALGRQAPPQSNVAASYATALAFAPDGRLFWAERAGRVRVWQDGEARTFAEVETVTTEAGGGYSERGLLGLAISPTFARDRFVYAFFSNTDRSIQTVIRWTDCAGTGNDPTPLIELPGGSDCCHKGGRLAFGPDGKLFVAMGDLHNAPAAQDTANVRGKILRYNADGTVPADNPFGAGNPVWAFGFRNPFGLAVSGTGQVAVSNNGPTGDAGSPGTGYDTIVASVMRGAGYQWPRCYGYSHPNTSSSCGDGQLEPDYSTEGSTLVPTGMTFVNANGPAPYAGRLVFCTLNGGMRVFTPGSPRPTLATGPSSCLLDVKQAPDNALYYSDTSRIYRLA